MEGDIVGARVVRVPWAVCETIAGETVLLDPVSDRYLKLNASGAALWELLEQPRTADDLAAALADRHGLDAKRAAGDARAFLDGLRSRELVHDV